MFDQTGKLLLSDAELEAEARAVASVTFSRYRDDAIWSRAWAWYLSLVDSPDWHADDLAETRPGAAVRQARAAIEAWKRNENYGLDAVPWSYVLEMLE